MSKKWGVNPKVQQKRQKQKNEKQAAQNKKAQKIENEKWKDEQTDKFKEKQRQKQREKEQQQRKRDEKKKLVEQEQKQMTKINKKSYGTEKMTVAEINKKQAQLAKQKQDSDDSQIQDIYNDIDEDLVNAHTIQQALSQLDLETVDKHPQKRMKAAWIKYVDSNLPRIKKQNTGMKRSQHLNLLRQEWKKAPQNPYNRNVVTYNTKV